MAQVVKILRRKYGPTCLTQPIGINWCTGFIYASSQCIKDNIWTPVGVFVPTKGLFWCLFPELRSSKENKHQNNIWVSTEIVHHECTHIILFLTWHNGPINDDKKTKFTHQFCVSLALFTFCWWRHNWFQSTLQIWACEEWYVTH